jgi:hypothetical protein
MADFQIRTSDTEAGEMLRKLAEEDMRSMGNEFGWIIRREWNQRHPQQSVIMLPSTRPETDPQPNQSSC